MSNETNQGLTAAQEIPLEPVSYTAGHAAEAFRADAPADVLEKGFSDPSGTFEPYTDATVFPGPGPQEDFDGTTYNGDPFAQVGFLPNLHGFER